MIPKLKITKTLAILCAVFFFISCNNEVKEHANTVTENTKPDSTKITARDISQIKFTEYALSDMTKNKTSNWQKFTELSNKIEVLRTGDLSFFSSTK